MLPFVLQKFPLLLQKTFEHIYLTSFSTLIALGLGLPFGLWAAGTVRLKFTVVTIANILQTIPSLALLAFLIPFLGIGIKPAIVALAIYAILPIIKNTIAGTENVPVEMIEAGKSLGLNRWQRLRSIIFPLAFPTILTGIRIATVMCVGIATIAAFIGAGGLGDFIFQGIALNDNRLVLLGAIPAGILALLFDYSIGQFEGSLKNNYSVNSHFKKPGMILGISLFCLILLVMIKPLLFHTTEKNIIRIATKNFTEQYILGYLMTDMISTKTHLNIKKIFNLGTTDICQPALLKGEIDIYPEYTGTAYVTVLKRKPIADPDLIYQQLKMIYAKDFNVTWLQPFGFNNSQALAVRTDFATAHHLKNISDLVPFANQLTIAAPAEFIKREDALPALEKNYHLQFAHVRLVDPGLMYHAIENNNVNVIMAFSTDGRIAAHHLTLLNDDKHIFPPYYAAPLIRTAVLQQHPEILTALQPLANLIDNRTMQLLNYQVDILKIPPEQVAKKFLQQKRLI